MKKSKYLNKQFGNWTCVHVGIANVQGRKSKSPGTRNYYYVFERRTSDDKADKMICLNSTDACKVWRGLVCVEELLDKREAKHQVKFCRRVKYSFN